jgi:ATP-dependent DNA ligase
MVSARWRILKRVDARSSRATATRSSHLPTSATTSAARCPIATPSLLDGEIVCLDRRGRPQFYDLLYHKRPALFVAFDLLRRGSEDLRYLPLADRKLELRRTVSSKASRLMYAEHIHGSGLELFERVCELDLEGIVAKHRAGHYTSRPESTTWFKIRNRTYSQWEGRMEFFERDRHAEPAPGWHACAIAAETAGLPRES